MRKEYGKKLVGEEEGFILVSVIVILAVLTLVGVAAMFKTNVQTKVSASSVDMAKALSAGQSGLAQNYSDWKGVRAAEKAAISTAVEAGTASSGMYDETMTPNQMSDLGADTTAVDAYVTGHNNIRVYDVTPAGLVPAAAGWGGTNDPQVALWAASFTKQTDPTYPYVTANTAACPDCNIVVYSLARAGNARSLQREIQGTTTHAPNGISAITNVPNTAYWADLCNGAAGSTTLSDRLPFGAVGEHSPTSPVITAPTPTGTPEWMIEATQAQYAIYASPVGTQVNIPSGVAFASNTSVGRCALDGSSGRECPEFEVEFPVGNSENTSTVAVYNIDPLIAYSGHQSVSNMRVDYANVTRDLTTPSAPNMPTGLLPHKLVNDRMLGTPGQLNFLNGSGQAFDLDAIRWGAEQFTCRASNGGKFCGKANALKASVYTGRTVVPSGSTAPVTGRLTFTEFQYNVANAIPMFGLVRVMYPAIAQTGTDGSGTCSVNGVAANVQLYQTEDAGEKLIWSTGSTATDYTGSPTTIDADGQLGSSAKLIVYGSIMIDFFADDNANMRFDPATGEHILTNLENGESKAEMQVPELINPALPNMASGTSLSAFPGITMNGSGAINLASPTNGNFPMIEGMVPSVAGATAKQDGRMELMNPNTASVSKLYEIGDSVRTSGGIGANTPSYFTAYRTRLEYYYKLARATANDNDPNQWPMAEFPANMSSDYCVGSQDCTLAPAGTGPNNDGDKFHLMFPSGYMHGWKVALTMLDLKAADWNELLVGTDTLAAQTITDSTLGNKGSPFSQADIPFDYSLQTPARFTSLRAKAEALIAINAEDHQYFYTEEGAGNYALLTSKWADIPAFIYSGGFMQIQYVSNISGAVYTPGPMAWGAEDNLADPGTGYFNGSIITGFGFARGGEHSNSTGYAVVVFDPQAVDNSSVSTLSSVLRRFAWEQLH